MLSDSKPLESIDWADLEALIDDGVAEAKRIEYKRDLPGQTDTGKRGFFADYRLLLTPPVSQGRSTTTNKGNG